MVDWSDEAEEKKYQVAKKCAKIGNAEKTAASGKFEHLSLGRKVWVAYFVIWFWL